MAYYQANAAGINAGNAKALAGFASEFQSNMAQANKDSTAVISDLQSKNIQVGQFNINKIQQCLSQTQTALSQLNLTGASDMSDSELQSKYAQFFTVASNAGISTEDAANMLRTGNVSTANLTNSTIRTNLIQAEAYNTMQISGQIQSFGQIPSSTDTQGIMNYYNKVLTASGSAFNAPTAQTQSSLSNGNNALTALSNLSNLVQTGGDQSAVLTQLAGILPASLAPQTNTFNSVASALGSYLGVKLPSLKNLSAANRQQVITALQSGVANGILSTITGAAASQNISSYAGVVSNAIGVLSSTASTAGAGQGTAGITQPQ